MAQLIAVARITEKGQITLPKQIRNELKLVKGDVIAFVRSGEGHLILTNDKVILPEPTST